MQSVTDLKGAVRDALEHIDFEDDCTACLFPISRLEEFDSDMVEVVLVRNYDGWSDEVEEAFLRSSGRTWDALSPLGVFGRTGVSKHSRTRRTADASEWTQL